MHHCLKRTLASRYNEATEYPVADEKQHLKKKGRGK
ncbi:hypothetical protein JZO67_003925 [Enterococcus sp. 665A]|uniref:Uncharacterized protein n=1 Tax=Candidatus Enterococcus ferrettii TaxID=2815324 RepID=A0ABV0EWF4_9ENTE